MKVSYIRYIGNFSGKCANTLVSKVSSAYSTTISFIRSCGNLVQFISPITVGILSTQSMGFFHFLLIFGQNQLLNHSLKYIFGTFRFASGLRPDYSAYDGMPSGHTMAAWGAASYALIHLQGKYKYSAIIFYVLAAVTAISRILSCKHTLLQVIVACLFSEIISIVNYFILKGRYKGVFSWKISPQIELKF